MRAVEKAVVATAGAVTEVEKAVAATAAVQAAGEEVVAEMEVAAVEARQEAKLVAALVDQAVVRAVVEVAIPVAAIVAAAVAILADPVVGARVEREAAVERRVEAEWERDSKAMEARQVARVARWEVKTVELGRSKGRAAA